MYTLYEYQPYAFGATRSPRTPSSPGSILKPQTKPLYAAPCQTGYLLSTRKRTNMWSTHSVSEAAGTTPCDSTRMLVLSLKPRHAEAIVAGTKTVELRRTRPNVDMPTRALIYSTSPVKSLVGSCRVDLIESQTLRELWRLASDRAGVSRHEFHEYFAGLGQGVALHLSGVQRAATPVSLSQLRRLVPGFRPPQSFAYLPAADGDRILAAAM